MLVQGILSVRYIFKALVPWKNRCRHVSLTVVWEHLLVYMTTIYFWSCRTVSLMEFGSFVRVTYASVTCGNTFQDSHAGVFLLPKTINTYHSLLEHGSLGEPFVAGSKVRNDQVRYRMSAKILKVMLGPFPVVEFIYCGHSKYHQFSINSSHTHSCITLMNAMCNMECLPPRVYKKSWLDH